MAKDKEKVFCRSNYDLGDFNDDEKGGGERIVDDSLYEPTEVIIGRMLQGEIIQPRFNPVYELNKDVDIDLAEANMDITRRPGFDIADVGRIMDQAAQEKQKLREAKLSQPKVEKAVPADPAVPAVK